MTMVNAIHHADGADFMAQEMSPAQVALTVTSPPYDTLRDYKGYKFPFTAIADGLFRVTKNGGVVVWVVGDKIIKGNRTLTSFRQGLYFQSIGFNIHDLMIYQKKQTPFIRGYAYTNCYEFMFILSKGRPATFNPIKVPTKRKSRMRTIQNRLQDGTFRYEEVMLKDETPRKNIWQYSVGLGGTTNDRIAFDHPAIFPDQLAADHILSWSNPGDLVFDPMCGSGTTCKMAKLLGRDFLGVDCSANYVEIAKQRVDATGLELV